MAITAEVTYTLRFDRNAYNAKIEEGTEIIDRGIEEAFEVVASLKLSDKLSNPASRRSNDCFIYPRLYYVVGSSQSSALHTSLPSPLHPISRGTPFSSSSSTRLSTLLSTLQQPLSTDFKHLALRITIDLDHGYPDCP